jgi:hypothetical protein
MRVWSRSLITAVFVNGDEASRGLTGLEQPRQSGSLSCEQPTSGTSRHAALIELSVTGNNMRAFVPTHTDGHRTSFSSDSFDPLFSFTTLSIRRLGFCDSNCLKLANITRH